ncbi:MAG: CBS domain-containing protein [Halococcoides sp.]
MATAALPQDPPHPSEDTMLISEVMSTDFRTVPRSESLKAAVGVMLKADVEAVIITDGGDPSGIVTRRKALIASFKTDDPLSEIPLAGFSSGFPTSVAPDSTVLFAIGQLVSSNLEVLPVIDDLDLVGIVTRENMLDEYSNLRNEAFDSLERRTEWESKTFEYP